MLGFWGGALLAALCVALVGVLIELVILRRIYAAPELLQLIATFGIVLIVKDAVLYLWGPEDLLGPRAPGLRGAVHAAGQAVSDLRPAADRALGPVFLALVWLLLTRTEFGTKVRAATEDRDMAAALGVNQALLFTSVFALGSFLAGLGGALALPREPANLSMDLSIIADVFVVTVVGGLGSIPGAYVAAVIISVVKAWCIGLGDVALLGTALSFSKLTLVAEFLVMAVVLIVRPWGLFGSEPASAHASAAPALALAPPGRSLLIAVAAVAAVLVLFPLDGRSLSPRAYDRRRDFCPVCRKPGTAYGRRAAWHRSGMLPTSVPALMQRPSSPRPACLLCRRWCAACVFAGLLALLFGWFAVRLAGVSLAMLTLAFAQIAWAVAFQWDDVTGGSNGIVGVWPPAALEDKAAYYLVALLVAGAGIAFAWRTRACTVRLPAESRARLARPRRGRRHPYAPRCSGRPLRCRVRWQVWRERCSCSRRARCRLIRSAIPRSVDALVMVLLGGVETLTGPVVGAALFTLLQDWITRATPYWHAVLGVSRRRADDPLSARRGGHHPATPRAPAGAVMTVRSRGIGEGLQGLQGRRRRQLLGGRRRDGGADRSQWRGQDDDVQHGQRAARAGSGSRAA